MIKKLVDFLGEDRYIVDSDKDRKKIEVRERANGIVNQDIIFVLACNELKYELFK
ncbi:TPA: hypothetical protein UPS10_002881, partial [Listeria monocytogenes]|nr:hypothetical protein [Listeria monocytogenes]HEL8745329.1 hypothetical protein [Listeria monocytogenes]